MTTKRTYRMDEIGIDLTQHKAKTFDNLEDNYYDLVIPLSPEAQHRAVEMTRVMACKIEFWNIFDKNFQFPLLKGVPTVDMVWRSPQGPYNGPK